MSSRFRRIAPILLVATFVAAFAPAPVAAVQEASRAEARLLSLINGARRDVGRIRLLWDNRLADIAQDRSDEMARKKVLAHPSSAAMADMLRAKSIVWYHWGETLVKTPPNASALDAAKVAMDTWRKSPAHWDLLSRRDFNYVAIGMARARDGWYYWTTLLLKGPDRTAPQASMVGARKGSISSGKRPVTVSWTGNDVRMSVLTSGLRDFRLQRRVGTNSWRRVTDWTTATSRKFSLTVGKTYRFRVRARDWAGNRSTWSVAITVKP